MARKGLVIGLCVLGVAAGVASAAPETPAAKRASLHVLDMRPLAVRGFAFQPNERVQVRLASGGLVQTRMKLASPAGVFKVRFAASVGSCGGFSLQAFGARGSRAWVLPRRPQLDCMSPEHVGRYYPDAKATS